MTLASQISGDQTISGSLIVTGNISTSSNSVLVGSSGFLSRSQIIEEPLATYTVSPLLLGVHDNLTSRLPQTASGDDLALIDTTFGTNAVLLESADQASNGALTSAYARFLFPMPVEYVADGDIKVRLVGGMSGSVADTTAQVDVECHANDGAGGVGSDLCSTGPISINTLLSTSATTADFTISSSGISPGDVLDIRFSIQIEDAATPSGVKGQIIQVAVLMDVKG